MQADDLERLSRLQAGELDAREAAALREEIAQRPELQVLLHRLEALDDAAASLSAQGSLDVEGAIARVTKPRAPRRWPYVVLAAAAAIALGVWLSWPASSDAPLPEQKKQQTLIAAVDATQGTEHVEEGERVSRLKNGTALYRGDWSVLVDDRTLLVRGVALISTNPSEAALHVTTLVTPTNEESDMIRNATKQWALAAGLSVFVLAGEVQADDGAVKAGQSWTKKTAAAPVKNTPKPAQLAAQPQPREPKDGECASCDPNNFVADNPVAQEVNIGNSPSIGPADAKVTVVLFSEAECSFCVKSHAVLKDLQKLYAGKVRFVFKHFPLPAHAGARQAAIALHAAHAQGKFWEMVESAYGTPVSSEGGLYDAQARALGLDLQQYRRDVANPATAAVIDADIAEGKRLGVKGVPAWFINGKEIVGHRPLETMREAIDAQLK